MKKVIKYIKWSKESGYIWSEWQNTEEGNFIDCNNFDTESFSAAEIFADVLRDCYNVEATAEGDKVTTKNWNDNDETEVFEVLYFDAE